MSLGARMSTLKKLKVDKPVVDLDGDEMTRIIWGYIKSKAGRTLYTARHTSLSIVGAVHRSVS
jgi:isocitrate dehydrogenase